MMPFQSSGDQELIASQETVIIHGGLLSRRAIDIYLHQLPSLKIKYLTLRDFDHFKHSALEICFSGCICGRLHPHYNYIAQAITAFVQNPNIKSLDLSNEFVRRIRPAYQGVGLSVINFLDFTAMTSLTELTLDNQNWHPHAFESLLKYLINPHCTLTSLILTKKLSSVELEQLKHTFENSRSLIHYNGSGSNVLQRILNEKNQRGFINSERGKVQMH